MRILVVEDEPALALRIQQALEAAGFAVDVAYDGEEGGHLGETETYDASFSISVYLGWTACRCCGAGARRDVPRRS